MSPFLVDAILILIEFFPITVAEYLRPIYRKPIVSADFFVKCCVEMRVGDRQVQIGTRPEPFPSLSLLPIWRNAIPKFGAAAKKEHPQSPAVALASDWLMPPSNLPLIALGNAPCPLN